MAASPGAHAHFRPMTVGRMVKGRKGGVRIDGRREGGRRGLESERVREGERGREGGSEGGSEGGRDGGRDRKGGREEGRQERKYAGRVGRGEGERGEGVCPQI